MFGRRKEQKKSSYDKSGKVPVIRASICTGEKVAGFCDVNTGKFDDLMLIRNEADLQEFKCLYNVKDEEIKREW